MRTGAVGGRRGERGELGRDAKLQLRAVVVLLGRAHEVDAERRGHLVRGTVGVGGRVRVRVRVRGTVGLGARTEVLTTLPASRPTLHHFVPLTLPLPLPLTPTPNLPAAPLSTTSACDGWRDLPTASLACNRRRAVLTS